MASSKLSPPATSVAASAGGDGADGFFWCADAGPLPCADVHVGFRAVLKLPTEATILLDHVAVSWYNLYVDGERTAEGPTRFTGQTPFFQRSHVSLAAGEHVIAMHVHSAGVQTRTLLLRPPAAFCRATTADGKPLPLAWVCCPLSIAGGHTTHVSGGLPIYKVQWNRISTLLGWAENVIVTNDYAAWTGKQYEADASKWKPVQALPATTKSYQTPVPLEAVASPASSVVGPTLGPMAAGVLWNRYGYIDDDPPARSFLRKLVTQTDVDTHSERLSVAPCALTGMIPEDDYGPAQGKWWRFDLGKCRLTRLELTVSAPAGVVFEISYAQELLEGRVSPWMTLCGSTSCYLDRYTLGADMANKSVTLCPLEPRGCRYIEVHAVYDALPIQDDPAGFLAQMKLVSVVPLFRGYSGMQADPCGGWSSGDALLNQIWRVGIETTRSCTEDTAIDGPCRERGQWTGDTLAVTLQNVAACYSDIRALKLCLLQSSSAEGVDKNGMISGNCPENTYPLDYVFIWFTGATNYYKATGDKPLLHQLFPRARRCLDYIVSKTTVTGLKTSDTGCGQVVDWGYRPPPATTAGGVDITMNCFYLLALEAMVEWCAIVAEDGTKYRMTHNTVSVALTKRLAQLAKQQKALSSHDEEFALDCNQDGGWVVVEHDEAREQQESLGPSVNMDLDLEGLEWSSIGYHAASMALSAGLLGPPPALAPVEQQDGDTRLTAAQAACIHFIQSHLSSCFPNDRSAPRAANPSCANPKLYTPYYATFSFPPMIRYGQLEWVLDQYRSAWGWAATQSSTWLEVFDPRWEKVHSWSGCPTWQLSAFTLGLVPRYDIGPRHYDLQLYVATSLLSTGGVSGRVPCREGDSIEISWRKHSNDNNDATTAQQVAIVDYTIATSARASAIFVSGWSHDTKDEGAGGIGGPVWTKIEGTKTCQLTVPLFAAPLHD